MLCTLVFDVGVTPGDARLPVGSFEGCGFLRNHEAECGRGIQREGCVS